MSCGCFRDSLHYSSPSHGDWGVVRIGMLLPQSVQLFICCSGCGRHGALSAIHQGYKDRLFYLYLDQSDIVSGYDDLIPEAVEEILSRLEKRPRAMLLFVSCLDDLIGTNHEAVLEELRRRHPEIRFAFAHMNPITLNEALSPPVSIQKNLYAMLDAPKEKDGGIGCIGNLERISDRSELYFLIRSTGGKLRHISDYTSFDEFQEMAACKKNLLLFPPGRAAARDLQERLGTEFLFLPTTYDLEEIAENYRRLEEFLACKWKAEAKQCLEESRKRAENEMEETREALGDYPIIVDDTATIQPFGLALTLLKRGFHVVRVEADACAPFDRAHLEELKENYPKVESFQPIHSSSVAMDRPLPESLALGFEGGYLAGSKHVADLFMDGGMFGYDGVISLMRSMREGMKRTGALKSLIESKGLVV